MQASADDARLLFDRWLEHRRPIHIKLMSGSLIFEATGVVAAYSRDTLQMAGHAWQFTVPLAAVEYKFSDPREIRIAAVRAAETAKYEMGLAVEMANGDRVALMEIRESGSDDADEDRLDEADEFDH